MYVLCMLCLPTEFAQVVLRVASRDCNSRLSISCCPCQQVCTMVGARQRAARAVPDALQSELAQYMVSVCFNVWVGCLSW